MSTKSDAATRDAVVLYAQMHHVLKRAGRSVRRRGRRSPATHVFPCDGETAVGGRGVQCEATTSANLGAVNITTVGRAWESSALRCPDEARKKQRLAVIFSETKGFFPCVATGYPNGNMHRYIDVTASMAMQKHGSMEILTSVVVEVSRAAFSGLRVAKTHPDLNRGSGWPQ